MKRAIALFCTLLLLTAIGCDDEGDAEPADDGDETAAQDQDDGGDEAEEADEVADDGEGHTEGDHDLADDLDPGESGHYGQPFTIDDDPETLADAIERLEEDGEEELAPIKIAAGVEHVCEKRGCWMALDDDAVDIPVRILMYDYSFFVPRNAAGADAVVEGALKHTVISEEDARHYAEHVVEQTGVDPEEIEGEQEMYEFTATGISLELPES